METDRKIERDMEIRDSVKRIELDKRNMAE